MITASVRANPKRVVFAEGEEESRHPRRGGVPEFRSRQGAARRPRRDHQGGLNKAGIEDDSALEIRVPHSAQEAAPYIDALYKRLQRRGALYRDCVRMVTNDRNVYAASMLAAGDADAMVTGVTRNYSAALNDVRMVLDAPQRPAAHRRDRDLHQGPRGVRRPTPACMKCRPREELADIAIQAARVARRFGFTPRVALLASSTFGFPRSERSERIVEAVQILDQREVDFEYDGEMAADVALDPREDGALSVLPADRHRECAHHAGDPFRRRSRPNCCSRSAA